MAELKLRTRSVNHGRDSRPTHLHFVQHSSARIYENKFSCITRLMGVCRLISPLNRDFCNEEAA